MVDGRFTTPGGTGSPKRDRGAWRSGPPEGELYLVLQWDGRRQAAHRCDGGRAAALRAGCQDGSDRDGCGDPGERRAFPIDRLAYSGLVSVLTDPGARLAQTTYMWTCVALGWGPALRSPRA